MFFSSYQVMAANFKVTVVDNSNTPLADMVVYLQPLGGLVLPVSDKTVEIGQLNRQFAPYINVMQLGSDAEFRNKDDITHHIYSTVNENKFSFKIRAGQSKNKNDFQQIGEVSMGCNIHDWMSGYLYIVDTPLFGKTNAHGVVNIAMEQRGKYRLVIWHPQLEVEDNNISQQIEWPKANQMTIKIPHKIGKISEQENEEDFDFLSDY
jgi:hypothetical protein